MRKINNSNPNKIANIITAIILLITSCKSDKVDNKVTTTNEKPTPSIGVKPTLDEASNISGSIISSNEARHNVDLTNEMLPKGLSENDWACFKGGSFIVGRSLEEAVSAQKLCEEQVGKEACKIEYFTDQPERTVYMESFCAQINEYSFNGEPILTTYSDAENFCGDFRIITYEEAQRAELYTQEGAKIDYDPSNPRYNIDHLGGNPDNPILDTTESVSPGILNNLTGNAPEFTLGNINWLGGSGAIAPFADIRQALEVTNQNHLKGFRCALTIEEEIKKHFN